MLEEILKIETKTRKRIGGTPRDNDTWLQLLIRSFYDSIFAMFQPHLVNVKGKGQKKIKFFLITILQLAQYLSMLGIFTQMALWSTYSFFWDLCLFSRPDYLAYKLDIYQEVCLALESLILLALLLFIYMVSKHYCKKTPSWIIVKTVHILFAIFAQWLYIPVYLIHLQMILYKVTSAQQYPIEAQHEFTRNIPVAILSFLALQFIRVVYITGSTDIRHDFRHSNPMSRCQASIEILKLPVELLVFTYYVMGALSNSTYFLGIMTFYTSFIGLKYLLEKPYYNNRANQLVAGSSLTVSCCSLGHLVGLLLDNAAVAFLISILGSPVFALLVVWHFSKERDLVPLSSLIESPRLISDINKFELLIRPYLYMQDTDLKVPIIEAFYSYFVNAGETGGLLAIWEAHYCLNMLKDGRLARIKLSKYLVSAKSLESDYQYYVANRLLDLDDGSFFEDVDFLNFKLALEENIKEDKHLCLKFVQIFQELSQRVPNSEKVDVLLQTLSEKLIHVDAVYDELSTKYSMNSEVNKLYRSFLTYILKNEEKAIYVSQRHLGAKRTYNYNEINYFDEENGILIVSGQQESIGKITYANLKISEIMNEPIKAIVGRNITDYIPKPFSRQHKQMLSRFLLKATDHKIHNPKSFFLSNEPGFLIEVYTKMRCVVFGHYPFFLILAKPKDKNRECIIIDEEDCVLAHTEGTPQSIMISLTKLKGISIWTLFPDLKSYELDTPYFIHDLCAILVFKIKKVNSFNLKVLYIYDGIEEKKFWKATGLNNKLFFRISNIIKRKSINTKRIKFQTLTNEKSSMRSANFMKLDLRSLSTICESDSVEKKMQRIIVKLQRILTMLKCFLFFLCFFVVAVNFSGSIYLLYGMKNNEFYHALFEFTIAKEALLSIANNARNNRLGETLPMYSVLEKDINGYIKDLEKVRDISDQMTALFPECSSLQNSFNQNIHYWELGQMKEANIFEALGTFITYSYSFLEGNVSQDTYEFLVMNGIGEPYKYIGRLNQVFEGCAQEAIDFYNLMILMFFLAQSIIIFFCLFLCLNLLLKFRARSLEHWERIIETVSTTYLNLQGCLYDRLENVHKVEDLGSTFKALSRAKWSKPTIKLSKYIRRSLYVAVLCIIYLGVLYGELNPSLTNAIMERKNFVQQLSQESSYLHKISWWTREVTISNTQLDLCKSLSEKCPFKSPHQELEEVQKEMLLLNKKLVMQDNMRITNQEIKKLFSDILIDDKVFYTGAVGVGNALVYDSLHYAEVQDAPFEFYQTLESLYEAENGIFKDSAQVTEECISVYRNRIILANSGFTCLIIGMILFYYLRFINTEKSALENRVTLYHLIRPKKNNTL